MALCVCVKYNIVNGNVDKTYHVLLSIARYNGILECGTCSEIITIIRIGQNTVLAYASGWRVVLVLISSHLNCLKRKKIQFLAQLALNKMVGYTQTDSKCGVGSATEWAAVGRKNVQHVEAHCMYVKELSVTINWYLWSSLGPLFPR